MAKRAQQGSGEERVTAKSRPTMVAKIITVLTRYRPIVLELKKKKTVMTVIFPGGEFSEFI